MKPFFPGRNSSDSCWLSDFMKFSNNGFPLQLELPLAAILFYVYFSMVMFQK